MLVDQPCSGASGLTLLLTLFALLAALRRPGPLAALAGLALTLAAAFVGNVVRIALLAAGICARRSAADRRAGRALARADRFVHLNAGGAAAVDLDAAGRRSAASRRWGAAIRRPFNTNRAATAWFGLCRPGGTDRRAARSAAGRGARHYRYPPAAAYRRSERPPGSAERSRETLFHPLRRRCRPGPLRRVRTAGGEYLGAATSPALAGRMSDRDGLPGALPRRPLRPGAERPVPRGR